MSASPQVSRNGASGWFPKAISTAVPQLSAAAGCREDGEPVRRADIAGGAGREERADRPNSSSCLAANIRKTLPGGLSNARTGRARERRQRSVGFARSAARTAGLSLARGLLPEGIPVAAAQDHFAPFPVRSGMRSGEASATPITCGESKRRSDGSPLGRSAGRILPESPRRRSSRARISDGANPENRTAR